MRIIISGGGTAGHTHPALAISEEIAMREKKENILFVLRSGGRENKIIEERGFKIEYIDVAGLKRSLSFKNIATLTKALRAKEACKRIIRDFRPDIVLGTGGYVCWPLIKAAEEMKIPSALHESNSTPGLTTRLLSHGCSLVMTSFEGSKRHFPSALTVNVGNPLLGGFGELSRETCRARLGVPRSDIMILSVGGSLGARRLNSVVGEVMRDISKKHRNLTFIHSVGERNRDQIIPSPSGRVRMVPYITNMAEQLGACDIVISRCGAMTLSEIALAGRAAILIPSPNVTGNHQYKNARALCDEGAAVMIEESELSRELLLSKIEELINNPKRRSELAGKISSYARADARAKIYECLRGLVKAR
ncbi:MAG: undecaprenyldiphospho-muramoylpentapeptide beta-N-acetylglucosaminyltransferase [Clostridia bacterium]|nr:undecaprenyldiphospho-muramoylpentapeptide beta-N-acetylglucosaminyltransferase [Clostridia bacterium]